MDSAAQQKRLRLAGNAAGIEFVLHRMFVVRIERSILRIPALLQCSILRKTEENMRSLFRRLGLEGKKTRKKASTELPLGLRVEHLEDRRLLSVNPVADLANH